MKTLENGSWLFKPDGANAYKSMKYHRDGTPGKTQWCINVDEEYELFHTAETKRWMCTKGNLWSIKDGISAIGKKDERFSFCPKPAVNIPWHGYPASARNPNYEVPENIIIEWEDNEVIDGRTARRIRNGRL